MRVLAGCEESQKLTQAFRNRGHEAYSCDLIETRGNPAWHIQADVIHAIDECGPWDLIILFPDCTAMACCGNRWYGKGMPRHAERIKAVAWTVNLWHLAKRMARVGAAMENPKGVIWTALGVKMKYHQPYEFGHGETKETGILTDRLPRLQPTKHVDGREHRIWKMAPGQTRKRDRSESYQGIMDAMADQWGGPPLSRQQQGGKTGESNGN